MRTCPKEEETVETCDGMNQKNLYLIKVVSKRLKNEQNRKNKLMTLGICMRKKLIFLCVSSLLLALRGIKILFISKSL